jgi:hypothetical protein
MEVVDEAALKLRFRKLPYYNDDERVKYKKERKLRDDKYIEHYRNYVENSMYEAYMIEKDGEDVESLIERERDGLRDDLLIEMNNIDILIEKFRTSLSEAERAFVLRMVFEDEEAEYLESLEKAGLNLMPGSKVIFRGHSYTKVGNELFPTGKNF